MFAIFPHYNRQCLIVTHVDQQMHTIYMKWQIIHTY